MIKKTVRYLTKYAIRLLACVLLGTVLLSVAYCIPTKFIEKNVEESAEEIAAEGVFPSVFLWCTSVLDNFTDTLMLTIAAFQGEGNAVERALASEYGYVSEKGDPYNSFVDHYTQGTPWTTTISYSRYWHGYLVFLKPALSFLNYQQIRLLNFVLQTALAVGIVVLLFIRQKRHGIVPIVATILLCSPLVIRMSLQFSTCYYLFLVFSFLMLWAQKNERFEATGMKLVFYCGIATAFLDFLTYPMITYCALAALYLLLTENKTLNKRLLYVFESLFLWCGGYFGMWASKWIVGGVVLGRNILADATSAASFRVSNTGVPGRRAVLELLYAVFKQNPVFKPTLIFFALCILAALVVLIVEKKKGLAFAKKQIPYLFIAVMPIVWILILQNHSYYHFNFTQKALAGTAFALLLFGSGWLSECIRLFVAKVVSKRKDSVS